MEIFNMKFVAEVEKHPELYNHALPEYCRKDCTEKAWNEIARKVNLPAGECKEKWRNLRSTFVKNLKPSRRGSGAATKRPYYLTEAMQFTVPFIKAAGTPSGNLPEIPQQRPSPSITPEVSAIDDPCQETIHSEDIFSDPQNSTIEQQLHPPPSVLSLPPSPQPAVPTPLQPQTPSTSPRDSLSPPEPTVTAPRGPRARPMRKKKLRNMPSDADKAFIEDFSAKRAEIANAYSRYEKREGVQNFLNSLIPDLMKMNDVQLRIYKRKALLLIDEVMSTPPEVSNRPIISVVQSYQDTSTVGFTTNASEYSLSPEESPIILPH